MAFAQVGGHGSLTIAFHTVILNGCEYHRCGGPGVGGNCKYMPELQLIRLVAELKGPSFL